MSVAHDLDRPPADCPPAAGCRPMSRLAMSAADEFDLLWQCLAAAGTGAAGLAAEMAESPAYRDYVARMEPTATAA